MNEPHDCTTWGLPYETPAGWRQRCDHGRRRRCTPSGRPTASRSISRAARPERHHAQPMERRR